MLFLDLDNFKTINDTLGHDVGDQLLAVIAQRLRHCVRADDLVSRFGGDEFTILLNNVDNRHDVQTIAENIVKAVAKPAVLAGRRLNITVSIGASIYPDDGTDLVSLKRYADVAMYEAKNGGKNAFKFFSSEMETVSHKRLMIQNELGDAISKNQLRLLYQPKIDVKADEILGLEVLVRWQHPEYGVIRPDEFIPYAEETGQIVDIDLWVLDEISQQQQRWYQQTGMIIPIAINLSANHLRSDRILGAIENIYDSFPDFSLELELTEAGLLDQTDQVLLRLKILKRMGISLSLDDFGTGYSSLSYLRNFPIDTVKIDHSFIQNIPEDTQATQLVKAIIAMAHSLQLNVVAEGVEREQQKQFLIENNCCFMQGFLFAEPLPAETLLTRLKALSKEKLSAAEPTDSNVIKLRKCESSLVTLRSPLIYCLHKHNA